MHFKTRFIMLIVLCLLLLTLAACAETKEDYANASDPEKFAISTIENLYGRTVKISEKKEGNGDDCYFEMYFEDEPDIVFQAYTTWHTSAAIPTSHYNCYANYEEIKNKNGLSKLITNCSDYTFYVETEENFDVPIDEYNFIITILDENAYKTLTECLLNACGNDGLDFECHITLKYEDKHTFVSIYDTADSNVREEYETAILELFEKASDTDATGTDANL